MQPMNQVVKDQIRKLFLEHAGNGKVYECSCGFEQECNVLMGPLMGCPNCGEIIKSKRAMLEDNKYVNIFKGLDLEFSRYFNRLMNYKLIKDGYTLVASVNIDETFEDLEFGPTIRFDLLPGYGATFRILDKDNIEVYTNSKISTEDRLMNIALGEK